MEKRTRKQAMSTAKRIQKAILELPNEKQRRDYIYKNFKDIWERELNNSKVGRIRENKIKKYIAVSMKYGYGKYNYAPNIIIYYI